MGEYQNQYFKEKAPPFSPAYVASLEDSKQHLSPLDFSKVSEKANIDLPSYNEKRNEIETFSEVEQIRSTQQSATCAETNCPSKLPQSYSQHQYRRERCGGCCGNKRQKVPVSLIASEGLLHLNTALSNTNLEKPTSKAEAKENIHGLKQVLRTVKSGRRGCHLSCQEQKDLRTSLEPTEKEVKGVIKMLKREKRRI